MKSNLFAVALLFAVSLLAGGCVYLEDDHHDMWDEGHLCDVDSDCGEGLVCIAGCCEVPFPDAPDPQAGICSSDNDCDTDEFCLGGGCEWCPGACSTHNDCPADYFCGASEICIPDLRCQVDQDCLLHLEESGGFPGEGYAETCSEAGYCEPPVDSGDSGDGGDGGDVDPGAGECPAGTECDPQACVLNRECGPGGVCIDSECHFGCSLDTDCPTGQLCEAGVCKDDPNGGGECVYNDDCSGGACQNGYCHDLCSADSDCATGEICKASVCRPDPSPQPECVSNADCADGEVCADAICRAYCTCDEDCGPSGFTCIVDACIPNQELSPECTVKEDCAAGEHCTDGVCF